MSPSGSLDTVSGMRRLIDGFLIVLVLGAVGLGAYAIGHRVDHESSKLSSQDSELHSTTVASAPTATTTKSHRTPIIIGVALGGAVVLLILGSATGAMLRSRKRESWRAG
jgi:hypothetical protein